MRAWYDGLVSASRFVTIAWSFGVLACACSPSPSTAPGESAEPEVAPEARAEGQAAESTPAERGASGDAQQAATVLELDDVPLLGLDGERFTLGSLRGDTTVIAVWALWCKPCLEELPRLDKYRAALERRGETNTTFVAISIDEPESHEQVRAKARELGLGMRVALDADKALVNGPLARPVNGAELPLRLPQLLVVDGEGEHEGHMIRVCGYEEREFEKHLDQLREQIEAGVAEEVRLESCDVEPTRKPGSSMKFKLPKLSGKELEAFRPQLEQMIRSVNPTLEGAALEEAVEYGLGQIEKGEMIEIKTPDAPIESTPDK